MQNICLSTESDYVGVIIADGTRNLTSYQNNAVRTPVVPDVSNDERREATFITHRRLTTPVEIQSLYFPDQTNVVPLIRENGEGHSISYQNWNQYTSNGVIHIIIPNTQERIINAPND